jgi:uncharacterized protein YeaO (DUF488 family)
MIPPKIFSRALDTLIKYRETAWVWVKAGRPGNGLLYEEFCRAEREYDSFMNEYFFRFSQEQNDEWDEVNANLNRREGTW